MKATVPACEWQSRWRQLVQGVVRVNTARGEQQLIETLTRPAEPRVVAFVNAHAMNSAAESRKFFDAIMAADIVLRDGSGMAILMRLLNQPPGLNLNGTDLIPKILRAHAGESIAFFGTQEPWLTNAKEAVLKRFCPGSRIAASHRPRLIVLGMGMPRQEEVAVVLRAALGFPCLIVCGGAIIDFLGGKATRAPRWVRAVGMEWAYRLALEPKRLFRRYVVGNPVFLARALSLAANSTRSGQGAAT